MKKYVKIGAGQSKTNVDTAWRTLIDKVNSQSGRRTQCPVIKK